jgi:hypothetical protein
MRLQQHAEKKQSILGKRFKPGGEYKKNFAFYV